MVLLLLLVATDQFFDQLQGSTSDSIVTFQLPSWAYLSTFLFGVVFIFYVDNLAEER